MARQGRADLQTLDRGLDLCYARAEGIKIPFKKDGFTEEEWRMANQL